MVGRKANVIGEKDCTERAKRIFGNDIVREAYFSYGEILEGEIIDPNCQMKEEGLYPVDGVDTMVEFNNGNKIRIWCSEWGGVSKI